ncbi:hypothetical protein PsYK624_019070 [Phanerochaete sordida]|uniref:Uncharacterized protein n=1 Tax=Phanerochaete sordida TaxID=48140 RepID=A0A9P3L9B5_9APHY|nr:hypothetical protein PsYK624_019070 [Phanerochaete sordida]
MDVVSLANKYLAHNSKRFRVFDGLSRVNRQFRTVAIVFLRRNIVLENVEELLPIQNFLYWDWEADDVIEEYPDEFDRKKRACLVRTIQIGRVKYPWYNHKSYLNHRSYTTVWGDPQPYQELRSFESYHAACELPVLESFAHCPHFHNLVTAWDDTYPFPDACHGLRKLETLRLYLTDPGVYPVWSRVHETRGVASFKTITTLALHSAIDFSYVIEQCLDNLSFPELRVLRLERITNEVAKVYDFIQRHPTILEATVHFIVHRETELRMEALLRLIEGTGTWVAREPSEEEGLDEATEFNIVDLNSPIPPDFPLVCGSFARFSFARRPLGPASVEYKSYKGSPTPRYECTALAAYFAEEGDEEKEFNSVLDVVDYLEPCFLTMKELRIASRAPGLTPHDDFVEFMDCLSCSLTKWKVLQRFSLHTPLSWPQWEWTGPYTEWHPGRTVPFLDIVSPPAFTTPGKPRTLAQLCTAYSDAEVKRITDAIRFALCLDDDVPLDEDDPELLMQAWEAHNNTLVARLVRQLASVNPQLEEFDWYVLDDPSGDTVLWHWKIYRQDDGAVSRVLGHLAWTGCGRGDPPPFPVYVGQESDCALRDAGGVYS